MPLADDTRGLAIGIVTFVGMFVVGALLFIVMDAAMADVFSISMSQSQTTGGADQIDLAQAIWDNILYVVLFLAVVFLLARAVREGARN